MRKEDLVYHYTHLPRIESRRLFLRPMKPSDAEDIYAYAHLPEVTRYLLWHPHPSVDYTRRYLSYVATRYRAGDFYDFAVVSKEDGHTVGTCGFARIDTQNDCGEVGYVFNPAYQHKGLATEALGAVFDFGFSVLGLYRIEAKYMVENVASRRLMERCGMTFEGVGRNLMKIKDKYEDIGICAITREDYFKNQG